MTKDRGLEADLRSIRAMLPKLRVQRRNHLITMGLAVLMLCVCTGVAWMNRLAGNEAMVMVALFLAAVNLHMAGINAYWAVRVQRHVRAGEALLGWSERGRRRGR